MLFSYSFSYHVFLECERDWFAKQSNERIPKKRWKFTYEPSPVLTHRCMFTSFRIVFLYIEEIKRFPFHPVETSRSGYPSQEPKASTRGSSSSLALRISSGRPNSSQ